MFHIFHYLRLASPGLKEDFQSNVFKVLAAILHLGNVEIRDSGGDGSSISVSPSSRLCESWAPDDQSLHSCLPLLQLADPHLVLFCELLAVKAEALVRWLCHRRIVLTAETLVKPEPRKRAVNARDALAKQMYAHLFDCIISRINRALQAPGKQHAFIGVLDIYGWMFEPPENQVWVGPF